MPDRASYQDKQANGFDRSLKRLGKFATIQVAAELQSFMRAWHRGDTVEQLNQGGWNLKHLEGEARRWRVLQIHVLRDYRVQLIDVAESAPPCIWFLEVFRKTSKNKEYIKRAVERARAIREANE